MTYATMTHRSAGYVVPASEYNQFIDNDEACAAALMQTAADLYVGTGSKAGKRLAKGTALQVLQVNAAVNDLEWGPPNSLFAYTVTYYSDTDTSEHDVFTYTVPGGILGTTHQIWGKLRLLLSNDTTAARTFTIKMYYKTTTLTMTCIALPTGSAFTDVPVEVDFCLSAYAATNAQKTYMRCIGDALITTGQIRAGAYGSAAVDSTATETMKFSVTQNGTTVALKFISGVAYLS